MASVAASGRSKKSTIGRSREICELALELGVSPRRLGGWEPATVTRYEYDDAGRLARSITASEPEYTPADVAALLAAREYRASLGSHGIPVAEATDAANQYAFEGQEKPRVDWAEKARLDAMAAYYERYDSEKNPVNRAGHTWGVRRRG